MNHRFEDIETKLRELEGGLGVLLRHSSNLDAPRPLLRVLWRIVNPFNFGFTVLICRDWSRFLAARLGSDLRNALGSHGES